MLPVTAPPATQSTLRQHPATSPEILAPYVPHGIEVEWFDQKGRGPYRGELEMVSRLRPYVVGHKHSRDTFSNLLPVLRPLSSISAQLRSGGEPLAILIARLLLGLTSGADYTYSVMPQSEGAVVQVRKARADMEPQRYCTVLLLDEGFQIVGPQSEDWGLRNVLKAYDVLRAHHVAVGLTPDQYAPY